MKNLFGDHIRERVNKA